MIVTITLNPSIDTVYFIDELKINDINRVLPPIKAAGGKGINCARAAASMGAKVLAAGLIAGEAGDWMLKDIEKSGLFEVQMTEIKGESRTSLTIMHDQGRQTEIIESGPEVHVGDVVWLLEELKKRIDEISVICISGSVNSQHEDLYAEMLTYIREHLSATVPVFVDTSGVQLLNVLKNKKYLPDFMKPNEDEFAAMTGHKIANKQEALEELKKDSDFSELPNLMISFGGAGAVCRLDGHYFDVTIPKIDIVNTTGSGDSTLAGMAYAFEKHLDRQEKIKYAMAFGMSNAQQAEIGKVLPEDVEKFLSQIQVREL